MINTQNTLKNLGLNNTNTHYIRRDGRRGEHEDGQKNSDVILQNTIAAQNAKNAQMLQKTLESSAKSSQESSNQNNKDNGKKRETYGLAILELMSDKEYEAWLRATAGMSESEKMLAVQKLYSFADVDKIKSAKSGVSSELSSELSSGLKTGGLKDSNNNSKDFGYKDSDKEPYIINANKLNGIKIFNTDSNFIQRYKNAFENLNHTKNTGHI